MKITYADTPSFTGVVIMGDRGYIYGTRRQPILYALHAKPPLLDCGPITLRLLGEARWA